MRGVRTKQDFDYEQKIAEANRILTGIETVVLFAEPETKQYLHHLFAEQKAFGKDISDYFATAMINEALKNYISTAILSQYDNFDKGHDRRHIDHVITESLTLAQAYDVDKNMVYTIAAYHDIGIPRGRKEHHIFSVKFLQPTTICVNGLPKSKSPLCAKQ